MSRKVQSAVAFLEIWVSSCQYNFFAAQFHFSFWQRRQELHFPHLRFVGFSFKFSRLCTYKLGISRNIPNSICNFANEQNSWCVRFAARSEIVYHILMKPFRYSRVHSGQKFAISADIWKIFDFLQVIYFPTFYLQKQQNKITQL